MLFEFNGSQCADIIGTGGKDDMFSWGAESEFVKVGVDILKELGFKGNDEY